MADLVRERLGPHAVTGVPGSVPNGVMVGDRPSTDGLFAQQLGFRYAHVWSGVTPKGAEIHPTPALMADDLAHVVELLRSA
jgi:ribonucleotide monophosphatase NagD (HAD superfamily)